MSPFMAALDESLSWLGIATLASVCLVMLGSAVAFAVYHVRASRREQRVNALLDYVVLEATCRSQREKQENKSASIGASVSQLTLHANRAA